MLTRLRISNVGVIEAAELNPAPGMTVVTGETGAGKTMVVTGLGMLLGERADAGAVRQGSDRSLVEDTFTEVDLMAEQVDQVGAHIEDGELLAIRQVQPNGRSRAWLGGVQVPVAKLAEITGELATIHGQSEQIRLGTPERQRVVLDRSAAGVLNESGERAGHSPAETGQISAGGDPIDVLQGYRNQFDRRARLRAERADLASHARERARELDVLNFGLGEIAAVDPRPGEDVQLAAEASRLQAIDDLRQLAAVASHALSGSEEGDADDPGAVGLVGRARKAFAQVGELDPVGAELASDLRSLASQTNDAAARAASYLADLDADPARLEELTARRAALSALTRKYGEDIGEVLAWASEAAARVSELSGGDERITTLDAELARLDADLAGRAAQLTALRKAAADRLAEQVRGELAALAMPYARLYFDLTPLPELGPWGAESVQLMFSANPGSPPGPLAKVASGGELSRVRLALEVVLAGGQGGHTFVFDEVDAGVGGSVAIEVGRRLAKLAASSQVIVVTHLAQVAAFADRHYVVMKADDGQVTTSDVVEVQGEQRVAELARMMAGLQSSSSLSHARELLALAARKSKS